MRFQAYPATWHRCDQFSFVAFVNRWQLRLQPEANGQPDRPCTLIARRAPGSCNPVYQLDDHHQGDNETVFFGFEPDRICLDGSFRPRTRLDRR